MLCPPSPLPWEGAAQSRMGIRGNGYVPSMIRTCTFLISLWWASVHTAGVVVVSICGHTVRLRTVLSEHFAAFEDGPILDLHRAFHPRPYPHVFHVCAQSRFSNRPPLAHKARVPGLIGFDGNDATTTYPSIAHQKPYFTPHPYSYY